MRLLPRVTPHVNHQHVLSLEGPLLPGTRSPVTHKLLLLPMDVLIVDVLGGQRESLGAGVSYEATWGWPREDIGVMECL